VNRAIEIGCTGSLAGDPGDREPQLDRCQISDVPVVSPATRRSPVKQHASPAHETPHPASY